MDGGASPGLRDKDLGFLEGNTLQELGPMRPLPPAQLQSATLAEVARVVGM